MKLKTQPDRTLLLLVELVKLPKPVRRPKASKAEAEVMDKEVVQLVAHMRSQVWFLALMHDLMVRGAVAKGRYWEQRQGNHMLVASDALARAVKLEKSVGVPAVVIADDVEIPDALWFHRFQNGGLFLTPILHCRDRNIINPFNLTASKPQVIFRFSLRLILSP